MDRDELEKRVKAIPYWYHRIELPGGVVTPGWAPLCAERYSIPKDLTGKRVLDIGAWDGYWTWEALRRGAKEVVAIDDFSDTLGTDVERRGWETFDLCREAFGFTINSSRRGITDPGIPDIHAYDHKDPSKEVVPMTFPSAGTWQNDAGQQVCRLKFSVFELSEAIVGRFDIVFFFGTIYHLKHPLLALEKVAAVCDGALYIETASLDEYSPYRGGLGQGYAHNEMVCEFYPGAQYGNNASNWWAPTLQCLGAMMETAGFKDVEAWPLTETPKNLAQCRGFASGTKDPAREPALHPADVEAQVKMEELRVAAVMSVPRLGFHDNMTCVFEAFSPLRIPVCKVQGAFWGQCLERGMQRVIDEQADVIITIDYDTVFKKADVQALLRLMMEHPEAAAIVPVQIGRGHCNMLMSVKGRSGQVLEEVPLTAFESETTKTATGHFGLTALRVRDLLDIPHPWFHGQPNADGYWGPGRTDDDMWFWKQLGRHGKTVLSANRVVVGHLELMTAWPTQEGRAIYQPPDEYHKAGKPPNAWK